MIGGLITLASYGLSNGGDIGNLLFNLEQMGVFAYLLPFLLIFAIVYGVLTNVKLLGENKGINLVLSLSIGLMALQFNFVSVFFSEIFPRLGVGLSIILVVMVLLGAFIDFNDQSNKWIKVVFGILGAVIALIVVLQSLGSSFMLGGNWGFSNLGYFMNQYGTTVLIFGIVVAFIFFIVKGGKSRDTRTPAGPGH